MKSKSPPSRILREKGVEHPAISANSQRPLRLSSLLPSKASDHLFAQFAAENFSRSSFRYGVDEVDFSGLFVMGEAIGHEGAQFLFQFAAVNKSVAQRNESHWNFPGLQVGSTDDAAFLNRGMFEQHRFDLGRGDRETL